MAHTLMVKQGFCNRMVLSSNPGGGSLPDSRQDPGRHGTIFVFDFFCFFFALTLSPLLGIPENAGALFCQP